MASETFIFNQITGLMDRGCEVEVDATFLHAAGVEVYKKQFEAWDFERVVKPLPMPEQRYRRLISAGSRFFRWLPSHPGAVLDSLNVFRHRKAALSLYKLHERFPPGKRVRTYDAVHCHFGPNGNRALWLRKLGIVRAPILTSFHGYDVNKLPRGHKGVYRELFRSGELFSAGSEFMRRRLISLGAPEDRVVVLPCGVDLSVFKPKAEPLFRQSGETRPLRLLTVARLMEVKGIRYALEAVAILRARKRHVTYTIIGDGPLREELESHARSLAISSCVVFKGNRSQEEVVEELTASGLFILPSVVTNEGEEEGQGVVLAEAQACGLPVVATETGGVPESLEHTKTGLLVPQRDPGAIAGAVLQISGNPGLRAAMAKRARVFAGAKFSMEAHLTRLMELYEGLAAPRPQSRRD